MAGRIAIELDRDDAEWLLAILVMKGHKLGSVASSLSDALAAAGEVRSAPATTDTIMHRHLDHYRSCDCLGDSSVCCVESCPCHLPSTMLRTVPIDDEPDVPRRDVWPESHPG